MKKVISGLIISSILISAVPSYASYADDIRSQAFGNGSSAITETYGISVEQSISNINDTIKAINDMKAKGQVTDNQIKELASQIYGLQQVAMGSSLSDSELSDIKNILDSAEQSVQGFANQGEVLIASAVVRTMLGLEGGVTSSNKKEDKKAIEREVYSPAVDPTVRVPSANKKDGSDGKYKVDFTQALTEAQLAVKQSLEAPQNIKDYDYSFTDVKKSDWFYNSVMEMTEKGLFEGKGNNMFCPDDTMTKAEFITVVARMVYTENEIKKFEKNPSVWWDKYYYACVNKNILRINEFANNSMESNMQRQEMALIAIRTVEALGETLEEPHWSVKNEIADLDEISSGAKNPVKKAYFNGILCGTDVNGTFAPKGTLTRAAASTVLQRIIEKDVRKPSRIAMTMESKKTGKELFPESIIIYEGQKRKNRPAKDGDVFVRKDGTIITIKKGPVGIVGEGQKVAPDIGLSMGLDICSANEKFSYAPERYGSWLDSTGSDFNNGTYNVNKTTGEGHWYSEWMHLQKVYPKPTTAGTSAGEISQDPYHLYQWDDVVEMWVNNF